MEPGWSGLAGGREAKKSRRRREISRAEEKRLPPPFLDLPQNTSLLPGVNVCNLATVAPCNWDPARAMMLAARMDDFVQRPPSLRPRESPRLDSRG